MKFAPLRDDQAEQLAAVRPSTDGICEYRPCRVALRFGQVLDRVYLVEAESYLTAWGVWPADDPAKRSVPLEEVVRIDDSPFRLPAEQANRLYQAGESGMGYTCFVVILTDGRRLPFVTGNAADFPALPDDVHMSDVADVIPHQGREIFRDRPPGRHEQSAEYWWCLYSNR